MVKTIIYPIRLSRKERNLFREAAKAKKKSLANWLREAGLKEIASEKVKRRAAFLDYPDITLPDGAETDKFFVQKKFAKQKNDADR